MEFEIRSRNLFDLIVREIERESEREILEVSVLGQTEAYRGVQVRRCHGNSEHWLGSINSLVITEISFPPEILKTNLNFFGMVRRVSNQTGIRNRVKKWKIMFFPLKKNAVVEKTVTFAKMCVTERR